MEEYNTKRVKRFLAELLVDWSFDWPAPRIVQFEPTAPGVKKREAKHMREYIEKLPANIIPFYEEVLQAARIEPDERFKLEYVYRLKNTKNLPSQAYWIFHEMTHSRDVKKVLETFD